MLAEMEMFLGEMQALRVLVTLQCIAEAGPRRPTLGYICQRVELIMHPLSVIGITFSVHAMLCLPGDGGLSGHLSSLPSTVGSTRDLTQKMEQEANMEVLTAVPTEIPMEVPAEVQTEIPTEVPAKVDRA